jgi:hypothetical protein
MMIRKILYLFILQVIAISLKAQLLDSKLLHHKKQIIDTLIRFDELHDTSAEVYIHYSNAIYSRRLFYSSNTSFFILGLTSSHSRQYLAFLSKGMLTVFRTEDMVQDLPNIIFDLKISHIEHVGPMAIVKLFESIGDAYKYNQNPPWSRVGRASN